MRKIQLFNDEWQFSMPNDKSANISLPHTWNGIDGQDGGNDYVRTTCLYTKTFKKPKLEAKERCIIQFRGVNSECVVILNDKEVGSHKGGYSTFSFDITDYLLKDNVLTVKVSNEKNNEVYPQRADFTFYGGIYRDVYLTTLPENHFEFGPSDGPSIKVSTNVVGNKGFLTVQGKVKGVGDVLVSIFADKKKIATGTFNETIEIDNVRLWNGKIDPFLYTVIAELKDNDLVLDKVSEKIGFRTFYVDPEKGFFLNGKSYPLRGVCRHQDRPLKGNAISKEDQDEDMDLILEIGANTVRLAHYQHDQYFYDLCDEKGLIVWAEIPYISEHMIGADENVYSQMTELINQNINHPSIVCWGVSNEIMIKRQPVKPIVDCHKACHDLAHKLDPSRLTVVANYAVTGNSHPTAHVTDIVSWNLYFGWYFPGTFLLGWKFDAFRRRYKNTAIGLSEYGAEGMPNLHSLRPKRLDNTEEYQAIYHENTMKVVNKRDYIWATHVWNMFDFGSDGRNQGGEPGMNHKGLVSFDRKIKKDAFYFYKAIWSDEKFVHICGKRFANRTGKTLKVKVYSNCDDINLVHNGIEYQPKKIDKESRKFEYVLPMDDVNEVKVTSGKLEDVAYFKKVLKKDKSYQLTKDNRGNNMSWEK